MRLQNYYYHTGGSSTGNQTANTAMRKEGNTSKRNTPCMQNANLFTIAVWTGLAIVTPFYESLGLNLEPRSCTQYLLQIELAWHLTDIRLFHNGIFAQETNFMCCV